MVIGPMVRPPDVQVAVLVPDSRSYHGELIGNGQSRADIGVQAMKGAGNCWSPRRRRVLKIAANCVSRAPLQIGMGREASRATHALATTQRSAPSTKPG